MFTMCCKRLVQLTIELQFYCFADFPQRHGCRGERSSALTATGRWLPENGEHATGLGLSTSQLPGIETQDESTRTDNDVNNTTPGKELEFLRLCSGHACLLVGFVACLMPSPQASSSQIVSSFFILFCFSSEFFFVTFLVAFGGGDFLSIIAN